MSGYGNPNGFSSFAPPTSHSNLDAIEDHCPICFGVFNSVDALLNHYDHHVRGEEFMNFHISFICDRNQGRNRAQRIFPFAPCQIRDLLHPQSSSIHHRIPPIASLSTRTNDDGNMIRPASSAAVAQENQPAETLPHEFDLNMDYHEDNNETDESINLHLTLGLPKP